MRKLIIIILILLFTFCYARLDYDDTVEFTQLYIGRQSYDGAWRLIKDSSDNFLIQQKQSGTWTTEITLSETAFTFSGTDLTVTGDFTVTGSTVADSIYSNCLVASDSIYTPKIYVGYGTAAKPAIVPQKDSDTGLSFESAFSGIYLDLGGAHKWAAKLSSFGSYVSSGASLVQSGVTCTQPGLIPLTSDGNTGIGNTSGGDSLCAISGGKQTAQFRTATNAVNYHTFYPSATGDSIRWIASGTDGNIDISIEPKGTGKVEIKSDLQVNGDNNWSDMTNGTIGFADSSATITFTDDDAWVEINNAYNSLFTLKPGYQNTSLTNGNKIIVEKNGVYHVHHRVSGQAGANSKRMKVSVAKNDTTSLCCCVTFDSKSSSAIGTHSGFGEVIVTDAPDTLFMIIKNVTDTTSEIIYCGGLQVTRIRGN